jgi:hypothetical protein
MRHATKMISEQRHLSYEDRLAALKFRRLKGDLIQQYKITHGFDKVNWIYSQKTPSMSKIFFI